MRATLKRCLGDAGALLDDSNGANRLYDVLKSMAKAAGDVLAILVASPSAAVILTRLIDQPTRLAGFGIDIGTCGSSGTTTVVVNKNGTPITSVTLSIANDEADGTSKFLDVDDFGDVELDQGDIISIEVTAAATGVAALNATVRLNPIKVED